MKKPRKRLSPLDRAAAACERACSILRKKHGDDPDVAAAAVGISRQAMWKWVTVPPLQVLKVSKMTGIPPHLLRPDLPDLFPKP